LIIPIADGTQKSPTTFEVSEYLQKNSAFRLHVTDVKQLGVDVGWLKYKVESSRS
jgi:hypothetical protein